MKNLSLKDFFKYRISNSQLNIGADTYNEIYTGQRYIFNTNNNMLWKSYYSSNPGNGYSLFINNKNNEINSITTVENAYPIFIKSIFCNLDLSGNTITINNDNQTKVNRITHNSSTNLPIEKITINQLEVEDSSLNDFNLFNNTSLGFRFTNDKLCFSGKSTNDADFSDEDIVYIRHDDHAIIGPIDEYYNGSYFGFDTAGENRNFSFSEYNITPHKVVISKTTNTIYADTFIEN